MTDPIPPSLQRFGAQFEQAAPPRAWPHRPAKPVAASRFRVAAASTTALAAIAAAAVLVVDATSGAAPAYALTQNSNGTVTISLNNLTTGISQLNARLKQMGISYTVIPVTQNCPTSTPVLGAAPGSLNETITIGAGNYFPAGVDGYLAAEQLPNGQIGFGSGGMKAPLPTCFSPKTMTTQPSSTAGSDPNAAQSVTTSTTISLPPRPLPAAVRRQLKAAHAGTPVTTATTKSLPPITSK